MHNPSFYFGSVRTTKNFSPLLNRGKATFFLIFGIVFLSGCAHTKFDLQGHRGARGLAPENTMLAFDRALDLGVNTLELDVGITKDGVVVIHHDRTLNPEITRDANGSFLTARGPSIASLSYAELSRYDVGRIRPDTAYAKTFGEQIGADRVRIPTLAALFDRVKARGANAVRFNIETKLSPLVPEETLAPEPFVSALIAEIRKAGLESRVTIQSFDWRTLRIAQARAPEIATVYLSNQQGANETVQLGKPGASPWLAGYDIDDFGGSLPKLVKAAGGKVWSPNFRDLAEASVREAQALGLKVIPWTVNERGDLDRMLDWRVEGIITDYPNRLADAMKARK